MFHTTYTLGNWGDFQLLMVESKVKLAIWFPNFILAITYVLSVQMGHARPF